MVRDGVSESDEGGAKRIGGRRPRGNLAQVGFSGRRGLRRLQRAQRVAHEPARAERTVNVVTIGGYRLHLLSRAWPRA